MLKSTIAAPSLINTESCSESSGPTRSRSSSSGSSSSGSSQSSLGYIHIDNSMELPSMLHWGASTAIFDEDGHPRCGESDSPRRGDDEEEEDVEEVQRHRSRRRRRRRRKKSPHCQHHDCRTARGHTTYREPEFTRDFFLIVGFCFVLALLLVCAGRPAVSWAV